MSVNREPAIARPRHPAADLPQREAPAPAPVATGLKHGGGEAESLTATHNVRIKPSTQLRIRAGVDKLRYETGDRSISIAGVTDQAITEYLDRHGC